MNEGSPISVLSVEVRSGELVASASAFPRTRPSYPSRTIHVSHPLHMRQRTHTYICISARWMIRKGDDALENAGFDDRANDGVHAGAVAARGENCEFHL